jgi:hypothetical protein
MKIFFLSTFLFITNLLCCQMPVNDNNWNSTPIFYDDFTGTRSWGTNRADNTNKWIAFFDESGVIHDSTSLDCVHHNEHQIYQRENAIFNTSSPGYMILKAEYKPNSTISSYWYPDQPYPPIICTYNYISGAIETIRSFKFGYFEIKCSLPVPNYGNFPAFWLYSGGDRKNEIDVFEHIIQSSDVRSFAGTYFTSNNIAIHKFKYTVPSGEPGLTSMHTYSIEWSPNVIIWYFDGIQVGTAINETEITDQPMKLKANYALDDLVTTEGNNTLFPLEMKIDYIKVYSLKCDCDNPIIISNSAALNSFNHFVKKKITITNASVYAGNSISLRATDEIIINGNFEVPVGSEFYAFTHNCPE